MRILILLLFCFPIQLWAQKKITGYVLESSRNQAVPKASVFLNNTSIGTITGDNGYFEIQVPAGKFELIVSSVGFNTYQQIITAETESSLTIRLTPKVAELNEVVVEAYEKDGWKKWGKWFYEQFIGTSSLGNNCKIKNPEVLRFRISQKSKMMTVSAKAPLIIENKGLGYTIRYQLEVFQYEFHERRLFYAGFPFFEPMKGTERQQQKWIRTREETYFGSVMHFMRALYADKLKEEGYDMRILIKTPNYEKQRVKEAYRKHMFRNNVEIHVSDSTMYYNRILNQPDVVSEVGPHLLSRDSVGFMKDSSVFIYNTSNYILVYYKNKPVPFEYAQLYPGIGTSWASELVLINEIPIELYANGSYFSPTDLMFGGFWGWWEKISTLLPADY